ncbi:glycosyltransferase [Vibrio cholerae]|uniref:glycosyltransferase n=3 Tax=Vibrio cholerae TaxID=666 RepID=UPI000A4519D2|nr:glycosyltransferase [Vibrio cholerae]
MLSKLKIAYRKLPHRHREKLSKLVWYSKRIDALLYKIRTTLLDSKTVKHWKIEGDLFLLNKIDGTSRGRNILVFPVIDWSFRIQRPQHLARELGRSGDKVIYFTTTFNLSSNPGFKIIDAPEKNVLICQLNLNKKNKNIYAESLNAKERAFLLKSVNSVRAAFNLGYTYSLVNLPFWSDVACALQGNSVVYDCMDYHAGFENNRQEMIDEEYKLLNQADLVITTATKLSEKIGEIRENIIIRNAAEVGFFSQKDSRVLYEKKGTTIGYYGAIAEWFDIELLCYLAENSPEFEYVIIGNVTVDIESIKTYKNVTFLGEIPYADLTAYLNSLDVCIIPFKLIELTLCTNPVKVYEYLAAGKPVVATAMPEVELMSEHVHIGYDRVEFLEKIHTAVSEAGNLKLAEIRKAWALQHDWSSRSKELSHQLDLINTTKVKVSLIVLTYNNLDLTKKCLESIIKHTTYSNFEVIVVDNMSSDGTQDYLISTYSQYENFKIILNEANLGFAAGNNVGLKAATGDILVIINNDTYVAPYWLEPIVKALKSPHIGLVCPVTNNIGNEAKININYQTFNEMKIHALDYTCDHVGELYPMDCVAFFCVGMRRSTYEQVGAMSEEYGLGFFEDDDYCMRVLQLGLKNFAVDESFVHHNLSASFNKLKNNKKEELMRRNQAIFESKWGEWKPHCYRKGVY